MMSHAKPSPQRGEVESDAAAADRVRGDALSGNGAPPHPSPLPDGERVRGGASFASGTSA